MENNKTVEFFRALKFLLISISAGVIQAGSFALLYDVLKWNYWVGYLISLLLSVIWNFTINRRYTFKSASNVKIAMLLVLAFYAVFTPLSTWLGGVAEGAGVDGNIVLVVTMILNFILEFVYTRFVVYRNSCDTLESKNKKTSQQDVITIEQDGNNSYSGEENNENE